MPQGSEYLALLKRAMLALEAAGKASGKPVEWRLGGGVAIALAYAHRRSQDVDLFIRDPQYVPWLSPRLSDETDTIFGSPVYEESLNHLRIKSGDGVVDFVVGPVLTGHDGLTDRVIDGQQIVVETPVEVVAKKCFYRAAEFQVRDVFDFACLLKMEPAMAAKHRDVLLAKSQDLLPRLKQLRTSYASLSTALDVENRWKSAVPTALDEVLAFVTDEYGDKLRPSLRNGRHPKQ